MTEKAKITVYTSPETVTRIKALMAIKSKVSMGDVVDAAIAGYVESLPADVRKHVDAAVKLSTKKE